jgi:hypothetical protein
MPQSTVTGGAPPVPVELPPIPVDVVVIEEEVVELVPVDEEFVVPELVEDDAPPSPLEDVPISHGSMPTISAQPADPTTRPAIISELYRMSASWLERTVEHQNPSSQKQFCQS